MLVLVSLIGVSTHAYSQEKCSTVADCAQKAMEAAYQAKLALQLAVPKGAVMAFDLDQCPKGWTAMSEAAGRFVVGVNTEGSNGQSKYSLGETGGRVDIPSEGAHKHAREEFGRGPSKRWFGDDNEDNAFRNASDGKHSHDGENRPPYLALLYCRRD